MRRLKKYSLIHFLIKVANTIPHSIKIRIAYSSFGSKVVKLLKKKQIDTWFEISNDVRLFLDLTNPHTWDLLQGKDLEKKTKHFFLNNIKKGDIFIDVGANIGEYSLIAAKKVGSNGKVFAIEPLKENTNWLKKNFLLNNFNNYEILENAIGNKSRKMSLYRKNSEIGYGFLDPVVGKKQMLETIKIDVKSIDDILNLKNIEKVNMLKIDVEGYEYEVLQGCKNSFKQKKIEKIICEIHLDYLREKGINKNKIYSYLQENGFSIKTIDELDHRIHIFASIF